MFVKRSKAAPPKEVAKTVQKSGPSKWLMAVIGNGSRIYWQQADAKVKEVKIP